jgi:hypothetical protein
MFSKYLTSPKVVYPDLNVSIIIERNKAVKELESARYRDIINDNETLR